MSTPAAEAYAKTAQPFPAPVAHIGRELTHADRCDYGGCGAAAYVRAESLASTFFLLFCAHHFNEVESNYPATTHVVLDERKFLKAAAHAQANRKEIH